MVPMTDEAAVYFRGQLAAARDKALADAEDFQDILFAVERLGAFLRGRQARGLGDYRRALLLLVNGGDANAPVPEVAHMVAEAASLFEVVRVARNDALHQGAFARHLTRNAIRLSLVLEEALMRNLHEIRHFMVPNPVCAELWQHLSAIRHSMLANQFSFLPVQVEDGQWMVLSDHAVARFTRAPGREEKLSKSLGDAIRANEIQLDAAMQVDPSAKLMDVLQSKTDGLPLFVVSAAEPKRLLGILTSFDIL